MLKIGLTGGIGSGKSVVRRTFAELNIPVYDADAEAKIIVNSDVKVINNIKIAFGEDIYSENNELNKKKLAEIIFNNKLKLEIVNSIIHPAVKLHFENWVLQQKSEYIIKETAIAFESGAYKDLDKIITVISPEENRIKRVITRDKITEAQVKERMKNQLSDEEKIIKSDYIIKNDNENMILPQVFKIHEQLLKNQIHQI